MQVNHGPQDATTTSPAVCGRCQGAPASNASLAHLRAAADLLDQVEQHLAQTRVDGDLRESNLGMAHYHFQCTSYYAGMALQNLQASLSSRR